MTSPDALIPLIYHERQQEGSMLCAQHALNSLLQGNYFTAPDLASIAKSFDTMEQDALEGNARSSSTNMDDTGFFSVQVMDRALDVWGLNLVRWRSEQMRPFQESPHTQLAFVLNLNQHWFTLRRFGPARTDPATDPGEGHWFNLNSAYPAPKWVSRTYLGMFLRQSEQEGYSVFAVVQADPSKPLALSRTEADEIAVSIHAPDTLPEHSSNTMPGAFPGEENDPIVIPEETDYDMDGEDMELQAALAASLGGEDYELNHSGYVPRAPVPAPSLRPAPPPPPQSNVLAESINSSEIRDSQSDPIAESMARQQAMLAQMTRMQEAALRETYEDEITGRAPPRRNRTQEDEEEEIRRAIAASMLDQQQDQEEISNAPEMPSENNNTERTSETTLPRTLVPDNSDLSSGFSLPQSGTANREVHRVYDDEDAELQAALRESLQTMPQGYVHPEVVSAPEVRNPPFDATPAEPIIKTSNEESKEEQDIWEDEGERSSTPPPPPAEVDVEEMRRRRLARFGG